ncbi:MAG: thrombospondin type 3 repeat-containing protein, partial [Polyangiales bacterium]
MMATSTSAQAFNSERFRPALDRFGFLGFNGSGTLGHGRWNTGLTSWYSNRPLRVNFADGTEQVIDNRMTGDFFAEVGLFGRWSLALEVPLIFYQDGETTQPVNGNTSFTGFAVEDPRLTTKIRIYGKKTEETQNRPDGPGLGLLLAFPIPIGSTSFYASEGQFTFDAQLLGDFHLLGIGAGTMLGWRYRVNNRAFGVDTLGQELQYGFSLKPPIPPAKDLVGLLELRGTTSFDGRSTNTLEGDIGVRWTKNQVTMTAAVGMGFIRGVGQARFRAIVGVMWSPQTDDMDGDGIPDSSDECPRLPEDRDGFEDEDGCMDP